MVRAGVGKAGENKIVGREATARRAHWDQSPGGQAESDRPRFDPGQRDGDFGQHLFITLFSFFSSINGGHPFSSLGLGMN